LLKYSHPNNGLTTPHRMSDEDNTDFEIPEEDDSEEDVSEEEGEE
jgi:hypothetical protein